MTTTYKMTSVPPHNHCDFSTDRRHRYTLWRHLVPTPSNYVQFVGLNPSTADELKNDPTVTRCCNYAKAWGYDAMVMTNLFAFRATNPRDMFACPDPIGQFNDRHLIESSDHASIVIACWGVHGIHLNRAFRLQQLIPPPKLHHLGLTKHGLPRHPLYLRKDLTPIKSLTDHPIPPHTPLDCAADSSTTT